jgi:prepilin-type N-terminal cleavage/methylation domain-containing protein/prepilin-type processing-associated H-X9-DG protein
MRKRKAFTLVELLVVIGIIALLISILLPVLGSARRNALAVKCLSNLRQCYNAFQLYASDNKGFIIPVRAGGGGPSTYAPSTNQTQLGKTFTLNGFGYGAPTDVPGLQTKDAAWWMCFLAPYMSKQSNGGAGDLNILNAAAARSTCFWCPGWPGTIEDRAAWQAYGEFNHERTGYSMNYMLSFGPGNPAGNTPPGGESHPPSTEWANAGLKPAGLDNGPDPTLGKWWRMSQITRPGDRCLMGDAYHLFLMAPYAPTSPLPGQQKLPTGNADPGISIPGQCTFDWYRHGTYPKLAGAQFDPKGGSVAYNILFCDGHVNKAVDRIDGYKAIRLRYPG